MIYLINKIKTVRTNDCFIYPDGHNIIKVIQGIKGKNQDIIRYKKLHYDLDCYTLNGYFEYYKNDVIEEKPRHILDFLEDLQKNDVIDYYACWVTCIDRIIRLYNKNVSDAISWQENKKRRELYQELLNREIDLFPEWKNSKQYKFQLKMLNK
jgi:hypothetical protein